MKKILLVILSFLTALTIFIQFPVYADDSNLEDTKPEFRAAWLSHFIGSFPNYTTEAQFKQQATNVLDSLEYYNINAMIIHFRTHNNALYKSELNPKASWFLNVDFDAFDPMLWLTEEAHKRGIEVHAWLNPYRVDDGKIVGNYPADNPASDSSNILSYDGKKILNPGLPNVREFVADTIVEILEQYPVDAIHFDDYFYMNLGTNGGSSGSILTEPDQETFVQYGQGYNTNSAADKANWRREQVNKMVELVHETISDFNERTGRKVQFGISPTGIYRNGTGTVTYDANGKPITNGSNTRGQEHYASYLYADSLKWITEGWLDYILPQSYWAIDHPAAGYYNVMGWWNKVVKNLDVNLYSGIGVYMADESRNTYGWKSDMQQFVKQLDYLRGLENTQGYSIYSYKEVNYGYTNTSRLSTTQINNAKPLMDNVVVLPRIKSMDPVILPAVQNIQHANGELTFNRVEGAKFYYIYRSEDIPTFKNSEIVGVIGDTNEDIIKYITNDTTGKYIYGVRALSHTNDLGELPSITIPDTEKPVISIDKNKTGDFYNEPIQIELSTSEPALSIYYRIHNGSVWSQWIKYDGPIQINKYGKYTIEYKSKNALDEESPVGSEIIELRVPFIEDNQFVERNGEYVYFNGTNTKVELPKYYFESKKEVRAVWYSIENNEAFKNAQTESQVKDVIDDLLDNLESMKVNTLYFKVRYQNDAIYPSNLAPISSMIQFEYDFLPYLINEAHKRGIEIHAWLNPFRVTNSKGLKETQLSLLDNENYAKQNPNHVIQYQDESLMLNPNIEAVRLYLVSVVEEIISKYYIDGILLDHEFYAHQIDSTVDGIIEQDELSADDIRRNNVTLTIESVNSVIKNYNESEGKYIKLGVAPTAIWQNKSSHELGSNTKGLEGYSTLYLDSLTWIENNLVDYIMPQLYTSFDNEDIPFADIVKWWNDAVSDSNVKLIMSHDLGLYELGENGWIDSSELLEQLRFLKIYGSVIGSSILDYSVLESEHIFVKEATLRLASTYWLQTPKHPWDNNLIVIDTNHPGEFNYLTVVMIATIGGIVTVLASVFIFWGIKKRKDKK